MTQITLDAVDLPTGVRLPYAEHGDADGTPLLLLHGWTDSWRSWEHVLPALPTDVRALAVTQRGHGDATRPAAGYAPADFAADAVALLDALAIERAVVCGHSMGGWIAQQVAIAAPERVLGAVLSATTAAPARSAVMASLRDELVAHVSDPVAYEVAYAFQASTTARPLPAEQLEAFVQESLKLPARVWREVYEGFAVADLVDELPRLTAPALVVWGDRDEIVDRQEQQQLVDAIPQASLSVYEGCGHALHWEDPERFAAELAAFAAGCAGSGS